MKRQFFGKSYCFLDVNTQDYKSAARSRWCIVFFLFFTMIIEVSKKNVDEADVLEHTHCLFFVLI